ncbi:MAG: UDP-N-acetylmuramoyl-tripeptide--D-alanyl-D-alanine ligase [Microgenomates group bacterium Gr01-1014_7]|nr:MAG: UDP-N-acetylmuramoyl-tripeptide--D-alanyl-D-alanine ligase [Microgenomates group bacterium Gr01-1014_7]
MDIVSHPIWEQLTPYKTKIPALKKPLHLLRIYLARQYAKLLSREIFIGVTGSVGKTTCTEAAGIVLSQKYKTLATLPNLDPILNIPSTILKVKPTVKKVLLEMGIEYPGEMDFYLSLVRPKTVLFTKISLAHSEYLGNLDEIIEEKGKLIEQLDQDGVAILNWDDPSCRKLAKKCKGAIFYFGTDQENCTVWAGNIKIEDFKTSFELNFGVERVKVNFKLLGLHFIYPALAAAALGVVNDIPLTKIKLALEKMEPSQHRMQAVSGPNGSIILDDTYNSSPDAVEAAIDTLLQISARRRVLVLGEMRELGKYSDELHRQVARKIFKEKIDLCFLGQGDAQIIADELNRLGFWEERVESNLQNSQIVGKLLKNLGKGDVVLIKGSRALRLDEVVRRIAKKG